MPPGFDMDAMHFPMQITVADQGGVLDTAFLWYIGTAAAAPPQKGQGFRSRPVAGSFIGFLIAFSFLAVV